MKIYSKQFYTYVHKNQNKFKFWQDQQNKMGSQMCFKVNHEKLLTIQYVDWKNEQNPRNIPQRSAKINDYLVKNKPFHQELSLYQNAAPIFYQNHEFCQAYEGQVNNGRPDGIGKMYYQNGSMLVGHFLNMKAHGQGHLIWPDGTYYHGCFNNNLYEGVGEIITNQFQLVSGIFERGVIKRGKLIWFEELQIFLPTGSIRQIINQKFQYQGEFDYEGKFNGRGILKTPKGRYEGYFLHGKKHGKGEFQGTNKLKYVGEYRDGQKSGIGRVQLVGGGGIQYQGEFENGVFHGTVSRMFNNIRQNSTRFQQGISADQLGNDQYSYL